MHLVNEKVSKNIKMSLGNLSSVPLTCAIREVAGALYVWHTNTSVLDVAAANGSEKKKMKSEGGQKHSIIETTT